MNRWLRAGLRERASLLIGALAVALAAACALAFGAPLARIVLAAGAVSALARQHREPGPWPLGVFWSLGAVGLLATGRQVDWYLVHVQRVPLPHSYPWRGVLTLLAVQAAEMALLALTLRPRSYFSSWRRALSGAVVFFGLAVYFGVRLMHAPPYTIFHWLWVLSGLVGCLLLLVLAVSDSRTLRAT